MLVNLSYPASHSLLLRVTGTHQWLIQELKAIEQTGLKSTSIDDA